ncbi:hypothetical protein Csa_012371, partial [Cucumis sativus]
SHGLDNTKSTGSMSSTTKGMQGNAPHAWIIHEYSMCLQDPQNPGKETCYNYGDKEPL